MAIVKLAQWKADNGYEDEDSFLQMLEESSADGICPALCDEGCEVEPDGECEHGAPSLLLAMHLI